MMNISSEAVKAGLQEPYRPVEEMTEEELKEFRKRKQTQKRRQTWKKGKVMHDGSSETGNQETDHKSEFYRCEPGRRTD